MSELDDCIANGCLTPVEHLGAGIIDTELHDAHADLKDAESLIRRGKYKRATIAAYYAMFHAARAGIVARGYIDKDRPCLQVAFRGVFATDDAGSELADEFERARVLSEDTAPDALFPRGVAEAELAVARTFVASVEQRLAELSAE
jgi:uncharacterized protein (UPF0332 family)